MIASSAQHALLQTTEGHVIGPAIGVELCLVLAVRTVAAIDQDTAHTDGSDIAQGYRLGCLGEGRGGSKACPKASESRSRGNRYRLRCGCALATSAEQHHSSTREGGINANNGLGRPLDSLLSCLWFESKRDRHT
jgi:hypothetical protein